jgi:hypothetical protein
MAVPPTAPKDDDFRSEPPKQTSEAACSEGKLMMSSRDPKVIVAKHPASQRKHDLSSYCSCERVRMKHPRQSIAAGPSDGATELVASASKDVMTNT